MPGFAARVARAVQVAVLVTAAAAASACGSSQPLAQTPARPQIPGELLSRTRLTSFTAAQGTQVAVFIDGRPWRAAPTAVPLTPHAEIVLEVGPRVPPHSSYTFPPGT